MFRFVFTLFNLVAALNLCDYNIKGFPLVLGRPEKEYRILGYTENWAYTSLNGIACADCAI